jgi:predicted nucleic acid-binding Zn ribbon protein
MTSAQTSICPACGSPGAGKFCSRCGAAREGTTCRGCGNPVPPTAQFCSHCGSPVAGAAMASRDRTPWLVAGLAFAGLLAVLLLLLIRRSPGAPAPEDLAAGPSGQTAEAPPDISNMSPRERFNRLYNRVMTAAQSGDEATVSRFTPMALMAYAQLDTIDADARYHVALLKVHTGDVNASRALADTILAQTPGHLFGYMVLGTVARFRKDNAQLSRAYAGFLKRYDAEMKLNRPEYGEHRTSVDDFRKAALEAK